MCLKPAKFALEEGEGAALARCALKRCPEPGALLLGAVSGILDLPEGHEVVVIGTVYKEMKLKVRRR